MGSHMVEIVQRDIIISPLTILNYIFYITVQIFVNWRFLPAKGFTIHHEKRGWVASELSKVKFKEIFHLRALLA